MSTVGDELPKEMTRVRDEVMPAYLAIGPSGLIALTMMRAELDAAAKAMMEQDVVEMIRCLRSLKGFTT